MKHPLKRKSKPRPGLYWCIRCEKFEPYVRCMKCRKLVERIAKKICEHMKD